MKYSVLCLDGQPRTKYFERSIPFEEIAVGELFYHNAQDLCRKIAPHACTRGLRQGDVPNVVSISRGELPCYFGGDHPPYFVENE